MAPFTSPGWRTAAYRGAALSDVHRIVSSAPIPDNITTVVIAVGLNDSCVDINRARTAMHELKQRLISHTHRHKIHFLPVLPFTPDPSNNTHLPTHLARAPISLTRCSEISRGDGMAHPPPSEFLCE